MELTPTDGYRQLLEQISSAYTQGRVRAVQAVNAQLIEAYWQVGRHIVDYEQAGSLRAEYGKALISTLAADLGLRHGKGFSRSNLVYMRLLYLRYPISQKPSHQLSWSHYVELLKLDDELERGFYEKQAITEHWSVPELRRQKVSSLFLRLAASKDKAGILQLAAQGQIVEQAADLLREPYVFEFLKIPEPHRISETQLETVLCDHLQPFLLELGKGFTFVGRQVRVTINNSHYKVDLVFYHRILRCFVLIDLKLGDVRTAPRHRPDEPVPGLLRCRGKWRRRQPADWHHPEPPQRRIAGGVRHLRHEQPALRPKVPALPAGSGGLEARAGAEPARGAAVRRGQRSVQGEFDRVLQTRTGRIWELAERYATPLPQLTDEVAALATKVEGHLAKMGASWK